MATVIIIQFPGVNCEYETLRAIESAGLAGEIRRWNDAAGAVKRAAAIVIPGGFSYQDRIRGGVVAAKEPIVDAVMEAVDRGVPVLGICNGAQVLVESGAVPGFEPGKVEVALATNRMTDRKGYYCTWVHVKKGPARCIFTDFLSDAEVLPLPVAHGEGRFVTSSPDVEKRLGAGEGVAALYATRDGDTAVAFPDNPNGSMFAIAGMTNATGNVLAFMPHPERASWLHQVPRHVGGAWGRERDTIGRSTPAGASRLFAPGPGAGFLASLAKAL